MRWLAALPALAAFIVGCAGAAMLTEMPGKSHQGALPPLTAEQRALSVQLEQHVRAIASVEHNVAHPKQLEQAARYIETTLQGYGYTVARQEFDAGGVRVRNLEVRLPRTRTPAKQPAAEVIVVGAHYDSAPGAPGANDNGTGAAAVLELARRLATIALAPNRELRLVLFVNEEPPYFKTEQMGSNVHARALQRQGVKVRAMLSLETLGFYSDEKGSQHYPSPLDRLYPEAGNFIGFVGDYGARELQQQCIASFRQHAAFPSEGLAAPADIPGIDWSDHWAYRQQGWPAIMITDTAPYRYPHYHTAQDTPDKVDYERLARVTEGIEQVVRELIAH